MLHSLVSQAAKVYISSKVLCLW